MLEDIAKYLSEIAALGVDMFLYAMPEQPGDCLALYEYAGLPPMQCAGLCAPGLQIAARGGSARKRLAQAHGLLVRIGFEEGELAGGALINGRRYFRAVPVHSGILALGADENGRDIFARNYYIYMEEEVYGE